jgi:hypothetical protein
LTTFISREPLAPGSSAGVPIGLTAAMIVK